MLADRFGLIFLLEAGEARAVERLLALEDRLGEGIGAVEHVADLGLSLGEPLLGIVLGVEGADLDDPYRRPRRVRDFDSGADASTTAAAAAAFGFATGL